MNGTIGHVLELQNTILTGLSMVVFLGGFSTCVIFRRLSSRLLVAASGFAGYFLSSGLFILPTFANYRLAIDPYFCFIAASFVQTISSILIVGGLWTALVQIRKKVVLALESNHGRS